MNNKILRIQEMLMDEMERITSEDITKGTLKREIERSNALSTSAGTLIKAVNISLRVKELAMKNQQTVNSLNNELGITNEK